jgi:phthiocerol/phenolphthiocerol synthesis type-I polyketide synthase E
LGRSGIAIVGMAGRFADSETVAEFWDNLRSGRECVGSNARFDAAAAATGAGHWVEQVRADNRDAEFDATLFGLSPREAERLEPQQRIFLELAWQALEDGGYAVDKAGPRVGVFGGANFTSYFTLSADSHLPDALDDMIGADKDYLATRVAHHLGLQGPAMTVQSACSTSLVAVHLACQSLRAGECDAALAGGASLTKPRMTRYFYTPGGILSPDGYCRAFDADAKGTVFTDGVGVVLLMRLEDALARGHPIYAVIRGSAVNNDGGGKASYMAPSIAGQERVLRAAFRAAGVSPAQIGLIEAHGTATVLGDAIELAALTRVFRGERDEAGFCQLGSVKTNIGHTASAAGVAGLMKAALALKHGLIPPNVNFQAPNPDLDLTTSPFHVSAEAKPWPRKGGAPRFAGVSSFGVGGANAHAVLEEAPERRVSRARRSHYVLTLSARSDAALAAAATRLETRLAGASRQDLANVAYTLNQGRRTLDFRAAIVCGDVREAREALAGRAQSTALSGRVGTDEKAVGLMFPGQGSQYPLMGSQLYRQEPVFRAAIGECLGHLSREHGLDLTGAFEGGEAGGLTEAAIAQTRVAQPLIFMVEYALGRLLMSWGVRPAYALGHSVGEFAAACLAGIFSLPDALGLVALRGALMQALPPGAMLSVAAPAESLEIPDTLSLAALNGPRQTVVSGPEADIEAYAATLSAAQVHATRLRTSHAFHSAMMEPMTKRFAEAVARTRFGTPTFPLVSTLTGAVALAETLRDPGYWARQIRQPVRFSEALQTMLLRGVDVLVEVGPGRQLSSLAQQNGVHRQGVRIINTLHNESAVSAEAAVLTRALSRIWLEGGAVDWAATYGGEKRLMAHLPAYPFDRQTFRTDPPVARAAPRRGKLDPSQWLYLPTWRRVFLTPSPPRGEEGECWLVFETDPAMPLSERLKARGVNAICVRPGEAFEAVSPQAYRIDPGSTADMIQLFEALGTRDLACRRIVHAWGLEGVGASETGAGALEDAALFRRRQALGLYSLVRTMRAFRQVFGREPIGFDIVTSGGQDVTGAEALRPGAAAAAAFARVAPQENALVKCRVLDVDPALLDRAAVPTLDRLADALISPSEETLALRNGYWWAQAFERLVEPPAAAPAPRLKEGGVYIITGGMGHIGLIFARHLARAWKARLVLVGRSPLDSPERTRGPALDPDDSPAQRTLADLLAEVNALGGEAIYVQADVSDPAAVRRLRETTLDRFGAVDGIIFGAGTLQASARLDDIEDETVFEENYRGKVEGLRTMLEVFGEDPVDFGLVLSSISVVLGGLGLCAYSAANHVADAMVLRHRRAGHGAWTTSNWDLWADSLLTDDAERRFSHFLTMAIQADEGAATLERILSLSDLPQAVISTQALQPRIDLWIKGLATEVAAPLTQHKRPNLASVYAEVEGDLERQIADIWSRILGIESIGRDDDFFEMGGHSILAVQAGVQIQELVPVTAPTANLYEHPTIRTLAAALTSHGAADIGAP